MGFGLVGRPAGDWQACTMVRCTMTDARIRVDVPPFAGNPIGGGPGGIVTGDWSICGVDLTVDECPEDGEIQFVRHQNYVFANAQGLVKRIKQKASTDGLTAKLHLFLSRTTKDALAAVYDAHASSGDLTGLFVCPEAPYSAGVQMKIVGFSAAWSGHVRGLPWAGGRADSAPGAWSPAPRGRGVGGFGGGQGSPRRRRSV